MEVRYRELSPAGIFFPFLFSFFFILVPPPELRIEFPPTNGGVGMLEEAKQAW